MYLLRNSGLFGPLFKPIVATGGTITDITIDGVDYRVHSFTANGTFSVSSLGSINEVDALIVAGGGGGAGNTSFSGAGGGGGGAGGVVLRQGFTVSNQSYSVVRGGGGSGVNAVATRAGQGGSSSVFGLTAIGGGGGILNGGNGGPSGGSGGSGGGARTAGGGAGQQPAQTPAPAVGYGTSGGGNSTDQGGGGGGGAMSAGSGTSCKDARSGRKRRLRNSSSTLPHHKTCKHLTEGMHTERVRHERQRPKE